MRSPSDTQGGGRSMANHLLFRVLFIINWLYLSVSLICFMGEETAQPDLYRAAIHNVTAA